MSNPAIAQIIEDSIRQALRPVLEAVELTKGIRITGFHLGAELDGDGNPMADNREAKVPGIWITCRPYMPDGYDGAAEIWPIGMCSVSTVARTNPQDDNQGEMQSALWLAVQEIVYKSQFTLASEITKAGQVFLSTDGGLDDYGYFDSVTINVALNVP